MDRNVIEKIEQYRLTEDYRQFILGLDAYKTEIKVGDRKWQLSLPVSFLIIYKRGEVKVIDTYISSVYVEDDTSYARVVVPTQYGTDKKGRLVSLTLKGQLTDSCGIHVHSNSRTSYLLPRGYLQITEDNTSLPILRLALQYVDKDNLEEIERIAGGLMKYVNDRRIN